MTPASHAADLASVREALNCTPDLAELKLRDLRHERDLDALYRASSGACDFIDFTTEDNPDVND